MLITIAGGKHFDSENEFRSLIGRVVQPERRENEASPGLVSTSEGWNQAPQGAEEAQPLSFKSR